MFKKKKIKNGHAQKQQEEKSKGTIEWCIYTLALREKGVLRAYYYCVVDTTVSLTATLCMCGCGWVGVRWSSTNLG